MPAATASPAGSPRWLKGFAATLIAAHVAFRAWVVYPAYFYLDDYRLIDEAGRQPLSLDQLLEPYDSQLMPFGRLMAWLASQPESMSWPLLATMSLALAAAGAGACLWMLVTLFGWRRRVLALLTLYLTTALTLPAFTWWAAGLNQLPLQVVFFVAVGSWVRFLRGDGRRWLLLTLVVLSFGLTCYVKTLLVFPTLAFIALAYFAKGGPISRAVAVTRQHWIVVPIAVGGGLAYLATYVSTVPKVDVGDRPGVGLTLAERLIGSSFSSAVFGGPWRWDDTIAPVGQADPPALVVHLCWIAIALTVAYIILRRTGTVRAWLFLVAYVGADYVLLLVTRAQVIGSVTGAEYRYLTDAMCAVVLALGLATMELRSATDSSRLREEPLLTREVGTVPLVGALALISVSGVWSSVSYAQIWHDQHPGQRFLATTLADLKGQERIDLANQYLPQRITGGLNADYNRTDFVLPLISPVVRFPDVTEDLRMLTDRGAIVPARIDVAATTVTGPVAGCGWAVRGPTSRHLEMDRGVIDSQWWLKVEYLASNDSGMTVTAGSTTRVVNLRRGLHDLYVRVESGFDEVQLGQTDEDVTVCVNQVVIGTTEATLGEGKY